jgi:hypothetical protein
MARGRGGGDDGGDDFSLQQDAISERFEIESSDWAHFLRLFELELKISQPL